MCDWNIKKLKDILFNHLDFNPMVMDFSCEALTRAHVKSASQVKN